MEEFETKLSQATDPDSRVILAGIVSVVNKEGETRLSRLLLEFWLNNISRNQSI
jgi:hypothetical protein